MCGSACEPTCENEYPISCILMCSPKCFCNSGFLRNRYGNCVLKDQCEAFKFVNNENVNQESST